MPRTVTDKISRSAAVNGYFRETIVLTYPQIPILGTIHPSRNHFSKGQRFEVSKMPFNCGPCSHEDSLLALGTAQDVKDPSTRSVAVQVEDSKRSLHCEYAVGI